MQWVSTAVFSASTVPDRPGNNTQGLKGFPSCVNLLLLFFQARVCLWCCAIKLALLSLPGLPLSPHASLSQLSQAFSAAGAAPLCLTSPSPSPFCPAPALLPAPAAVPAAGAVPGCCPGLPAQPVASSCNRPCLLCPAAPPGCLCSAPSSSQPSSLCHLHSHSHSHLHSQCCSASPCPAAPPCCLPVHS
jgi:hypothetical protein